MKEAEFTKSSDKQNWMDTSVISDIPFKITIIDPKPYILGVEFALEDLPCIRKGNYTNQAMTHLAKVIVHSIMTGIVHRRRAWVYGDDVDFQLHLSQLREMIGIDIDTELREDIRYEIADIRHKRSAEKFDQVIREILEILMFHMNPNKFVVHTLEQTRDMRTFALKEFADWRVIEWTKSEQAKIDARHEDI